MTTAALPSSIEGASDRAASTSVADTVAGWATPAALGRFDELFGGAGASSGTRPIAPPWRGFFDALGDAGLRDLDRREVNLGRQMRGDDATDRVYDHADGPRRTWQVELLPLLIEASDWRAIEAGVAQRARLLERVTADVYGPRELIARGLLPPALVYGDPGYLRPAHGSAPAGGWLHALAFDLVRWADGRFAVLAQRAQAPSGLGYLLHNRLLVSRLLPEPFAALRVRRIEPAYRAWLDALRGRCPAPPGEAARVVLYTPGAFNETWFEQAWLARHLGIALVQAEDLVVRDDRVFLTTVHGLEPVHGLLRRVDDDWIDPLELRVDSQLGVPGLMQAFRAGGVLMANAPGAGFLEAPALAGRLPDLASALLGETLALPSVPVSWNGKPRGAGGDMTTPSIDFGELPTWRGAAAIAGARLEPRPFVLRVHALAHGPDAWHVLPGGLTRVAPVGGDPTTMQRGAGSADTWVRADVAEPTSAAPHRPRRAASFAPLSPSEPAAAVTSRAAENLFWLGRYLERCENTSRLARLTLIGLGGEALATPAQSRWLAQLAVRHGLLPFSTGDARGRDVERLLIDGLGTHREAMAAGVGHSLASARRCAEGVRERLPPAHWSLMTRAVREFERGHLLCTDDGTHSPVEALRLLDTLSAHTAALTGAQLDRMAQDDGWRFLMVGRQLERIGFHAAALDLALALGATATAPDASGGELADAPGDATEDARVGLDGVLALWGGDPAPRPSPGVDADTALIERAACDPHDPRSIRRSAETLASLVRAMPSPPLGEPARWLRDALDFGLGAPATTGQTRARLAAIEGGTRRLSDAIADIHFLRADEMPRRALV